MKFQNLESVCQWLLSKKAAFKYEIKTVTVIGTDRHIVPFSYASYHADNGKVVLMDMEYNEIQLK